MARRRKARPSNPFRVRRNDGSLVAARDAGKARAEADYKKEASSPEVKAQFRELVKSMRAKGLSTLEVREELMKLADRGTDGPHADEHGTVFTGDAAAAYNSAYKRTSMDLAKKMITVFVPLRAKRRVVASPARRTGAARKSRKVTARKPKPRWAAAATRRGR